jgi:invasion protein IalB
MKRTTIAAVTFLAALASPASAAPDPQAPAQQQPPAAKPAPNANENQVVCRVQEVTGSRLGARRICLTRGEWLRAQMDDKAWVERIQRRGDASSN